MYSIELRRSAEKDIRHIPSDVFPNVNQHILSLRDDPRPPGVKKLAGGLGWRIRVGGWRVVYEIDDNRHAITIVAVKPRQSAYR